MYDDEWQKEEDTARYLANKIKRCRNCRTELNYKEKFYNIDKICNACRGSSAFEDAEITQIPQAPQFEPVPSPYFQIDKSLSHLPPFQQILYTKYPHLQHFIEKAEQELKEQRTRENIQSSSPDIIDDKPPEHDQ